MHSSSRSTESIDSLDSPTYRSHEELQDRPVSLQSYHYYTSVPSESFVEQRFVAN